MTDNSDRTTQPCKPTQIAAIAPSVNSVYFVNRPIRESAIQRRLRGLGPLNYP